jgi:citrate lyase gamma subunit
MASVLPTAVKVRVRPAALRASSIGSRLLVAPRQVHEMDVTLDVDVLEQVGDVLATDRQLLLANLAKFQVRRAPLPHWL